MAEAHRDRADAVMADASELARTILDAADPSAVFASMVGDLLVVKTLKAVLLDLEQHGADLARLRAPAQDLLISWPATSTIVWPPHPPSFVFRPGRRPPLRIGWPDGLSGADLLARIRRHRRLLAESVTDLVAWVGSDRFALLTGRAFEVRYPGYSSRMEYDTDVVIPTLAHAQTVIDAGCGALGGQLGFLALTETDGSAVAGRGCIVWERDRNLVTFGFEIGESRGTDRALWERAEMLPWRSERVQVVTPEDLLLRIAAKRRHGRGYGPADRADVETILRGKPLDLDYVAASAQSQGLTTAMLALVDFIRSEGWGRPPAIWRTHPLQGLESAVRQFRRRALARPRPSLLAAGVRFVDGRMGQGMGLPLAGTLRRRTTDTLSLCALRAHPLDATGCVEWAQPGEASDEVVAFARSLPTGSGPLQHRCERFTVERPRG